MSTSLTVPVQEVVQLTASGADGLADRRQPSGFCCRLPHGDLGTESEACLDDPEQQEEKDRQSESQFDQDSAALSLLTPGLLGHR